MWKITTKLVTFLKKHVYYLLISVGIKSGNGLTESSVWSHKSVFSSATGLGKNLFP